MDGICILDKLLNKINYLIDLTGGGKATLTELAGRNPDNTLGILREILIFRHFRSTSPEPAARRLRENSEPLANLIGCMGRVVQGSWLSDGMVL